MTPTELVAHPAFPRALVVGLFGGAGLALTTIYSRRGPLIYPALADLRPVRHRSHSQRAVESIDFASGRAVGWIRLVNGDSVAVDAPALDGFNASSFDLVLRASPLRQGWEADVPAFLPKTRSVVPLHASRRNRERGRRVVSARRRRVYRHARDVLDRAVDARLAPATHAAAPERGHPLPQDGQGPRGRADELTA